MSDTDPRPPRDEEPRRPGGRRRDRALPILLILIGGLLLLGNLGWFDWRALFGVLELWPLLLVALGIDILLRGRHRIWVLLGAIVLGALLWSGGPGWMGPGQAPAETHAIGYELSGVERARIELEHRVGELRVATLPEGSGELISGEVITGRGERLVRSFDVSGGAATARLRAEGTGRTFAARGAERGWDLRLSRDVPLDLRIETGVGRSDLDLRDARISALDLDAGVGEVRVTLPQRGGYEAAIDAGIGEILVRLPTAVEARVTVDTGIGRTRVSGGFQQEGRVHTTPGFAEAEDPVELRVSGGVGEVTIERVD